MFYDKFRAHVEAILFASGEPITAEKIGKLLNIPTEHVDDMVFDIKKTFDKEEHGITIRQVAGGYQMCSKKELADVLDRLSLVRETKLSPSALETLSIIAFRQPVTKQEIEAIRGVRSDRIINTLIDFRLIKEAGRKEAVGRPILYATTGEFLTAFGLNSLLDLPRLPDKFFPQTELEDPLNEQVDY